MKIFVVLFLSFVCFGTANDIQTIQSFDEVKFKNLTDLSLVIFDVDEVLITPEDVLLKPAGGKYQGWAQIDKEKYNMFLSIMLAGTKFELVDPMAVEMLAQLYENDISAMALTSCRTGSFERIPSMEDWRIEQLKVVGIDFSVFFSEEIVFEKAVDEKLNPPLFKKGILFCGDLYNPKKSTKGELLGMWLDQMKLNPDRIVFIDDELKNLEAVNQELRDRGIPFQGYLLESPGSVVINEKAALKQIKVLLDEQKWISDKEAISEICGQEELNLHGVSPTRT